MSWEEMESAEKCRAAASDVRDVYDQYKGDCDITGLGVQGLHYVPEFMESLSGSAQLLTSQEFALLKEVFLRSGGSDLGRSLSCAAKAEELMKAITKRTGISFEQYT